MKITQQEISHEYNTTWKLHNKKYHTNIIAHDNNITKNYHTNIIPHEYNTTWKKDHKKISHEYNTTWK